MREHDGPSDPRAILAAHLDHGAGPSVFDDAYWMDSTVAAGLIALAPGVPRVEVGDRTGLDTAQIQELLNRGFVKWTNDSLGTSFPVVFGADSEEYYQLVRAAAGHVLMAHVADLEAMLAELDVLGLGDLGYHVVWSLVFDGQRGWVEMVDGGAVPPMDDVRSWVVHPAHPYKTGTNLYGPGADGAHFLVVSWRPVSSTIPTAETEWALVYDTLLRERGLPADVSRSGETGAPGLLLSAHPGLARQISDLNGSLHRATRGGLDMDRLSLLFDGDSALAFVAAYHDVGWEVVGRLVELGHLSVPPALATELPGVLEGAVSLVPLDTAFLRILGLR